MTQQDFPGWFKKDGNIIRPYTGADVGAEVGNAIGDAAEAVRSTPWMHNLSWPAALIVSGFLFYQSLSWDIGWFWKLCVIAIGGYFTYALFVAALFIAAGVLIIWLVSKTGAF